MEGSLSPLIPTLTSGRFHIKWARLADLPAPMWGPCTQLYKACSWWGQGDAYHQVYVYDINTDQWGWLPPPGHCYGIPHIIGGKLAIIGGCLSSIWECTNKVLTFNGTSQTWIFYYPDILSGENQG